MNVNKYKYSFNYAETLFLLLYISFLLQSFDLYKSYVTIKPFIFSIFIIAILTAVCFRRDTIETAPRLVQAFFPLFIFAAYMITTTLWASNTAPALRRSCALVLIFFSLYLTVILLKHTDLKKLSLFLRRIFIAYLAFSLVYYALGVMTYFISAPEAITSKYLYGAYLEGGDGGRIGIRMRGLMDSPNNLSYILMIITYFHLITAKKPAWLLLGMVILCLLLSLSISGLLALSIPFFYLILDRKTYILPLVTAGMAFIVTVLSMNYSKTIADFVVYYKPRIMTGSGRRDLFYHALSHYDEHPLFGYGIGQVSTLLSDYKRGDKISTHNSFIEVYIEGGALGLILLISIIIYGLVYLYKLDVSKRAKILFFSFVLSCLLFNLANLILYTDKIMLTLISFAFLIRYHLPLDAGTFTANQQRSL